MTPFSEDFFSTNQQLYIDDDCCYFDAINGTFYKIDNITDELVNIEYDEPHVETCHKFELNEQGRKDSLILIIILGALSILLLILIYINSHK